MSRPQPYKLRIETFAKSKARSLKFFPVESFVEGEEFEIWFELENIGEEGFFGGELDFEIRWQSGQISRDKFAVPPLKRNEIHTTSKFTVHALSDGYCLVYIRPRATPKDEQGRSRQVEFYLGKRVENRVESDESVYSVRIKDWQEIHTFQALIVATISLAIIAAEKLSIWLPKILEWLKELFA